MSAKMESESDSSLAIQCLGLCQTLARQGQAFSLNIKVGTTFVFSLDTRKIHEPPMRTRKKPSPSTLRRNAKRRQKFLESKEADKASNNQDTENVIGHSSVAEKATEEDFFVCESKEPDKSSSDQDTEIITDCDIVAEQAAEDTFSCKVCEAKLKSSIGLRIHMRRKHLIPQIDGESTIDQN